MKMRAKKIIAYLLVLALALPVGLAGNNSKETKAESSGDWEYTLLEDGTVSITGYSGSETKLTIPGVIDGKKVTEIGPHAFVYESLTDITLPDSVTSIGKRAFGGCNVLNQITVSSGNKNYDSRKNCNAIIETETNTLITGCKNSSIPDSVTSIGESAFESCDSLTSITIPDSVTSIGKSAFYGCFGLTSITLPNSVTSIGKGAFQCCSGLTSITLPDSVTRIGGWAFDGCSGLTSITIPDSVTRIGKRAFNACNGLTSITIPDSVTSIGMRAFSFCKKLKSVTIGSNITTLTKYAFCNCKKLKSVTIGSNITSIERYAFYACKKLKKITIKSSNLESIDEYAIEGVAKNAVIEVPKGKAKAYRELFTEETGYRKTMTIK